VRWKVLALIICLICFYYYERVHFSRAQVVGIYELDGQDGGSTIEVKTGGNFTRSDDKEVQTGAWHLIDAKYLLYDTGIEFDGGTGSSGYANEYLLTRRGFKICWEVREDEEYWCKKNRK
jgi:hypothetical protein